MATGNKKILHAQEYIFLYETKFDKFLKLVKLYSSYFLISFFIFVSKLASKPIGKSVCASIDALYISLLSNLSFEYVLGISAVSPPTSSQSEILHPLTIP